MTYGTEFDNGDDRSSSDNNKQHDMNEDVVITKEIITWGFILPPPLFSAIFMQFLFCIMYSLSHGTMLFCTQQQI